MLLFGAVVQTSIGFGFAIVSLPLLTILLGKDSLPLVLLAGFFVQVVFLIFARQHVRWRSQVVPLIAGAIAIPFGVLFYSYASEFLFRLLIGVIAICFAILDHYSTRKLINSSVTSDIVLGGCFGLIAGAFGTAGPIAVMIGKSKDWNPLEFRANLQFFFTVASVFNLTTHALQGNYNVQVAQHFFVGLIPICLGLYLGMLLASRMDAKTSNRAVTAMLIVFGITLIAVALAGTFS